MVDDGMQDDEEDPKRNGKKVDPENRFFSN